ncbi:MAG TPA: ATPase, T2SS/T4P/T4SS family, partial [Chitinophagaceae bacterium]|nr:ATPase, T2SS/T4P/T4SS family [Chitinophagaceae bacterium]
MKELTTINQQAISLITGKQAWYYHIIPYNCPNGVIHLYASDTQRQNEIQSELELLTGKKVLFNKIEDDLIEELLAKYYPNEQPDTRQQNEYYHGDADQFLNHLITEARSLKSSDIHIETYEENCRVRIRIDGMLVQRYLLDKKQYPSLINKIKIIANLDIAEKRLPQDGRIFFEVDQDRFDIRVSVLPTLHGEKIVLRLLNNDATN